MLRPRLMHTRHGLKPQHNAQVITPASSGTPRDRRHQRRAALHLVHRGVFRRRRVRSAWRCRRTLRSHPQREGDPVAVADRLRCARDRSMRPARARWSDEPDVGVLLGPGKLRQIHRQRPVAVRCTKKSKSSNPLCAERAAERRRRGPRERTLCFAAHLAEPLTGPLLLASPGRRHGVGALSVSGQHGG
jgi:hypothetical protein